MNTEVTSAESPRPRRQLSSLRSPVRGVRILTPVLARARATILRSSAPAEASRCDRFSRRQRGPAPSPQLRLCPSLRRRRLRRRAPSSLHFGGSCCWHLRPCPSLLSSAQQVPAHACVYDCIPPESAE